MSPDNQRLTANDRANLVAYLDGELTEAESQSIATKLTHSTTARHEVDGLEKTWELLDYLARPKASPDLTTQTLTEVRRLDERGGQMLATAGTATRRAAQVAALLLALAAATGVGYALARWAWPDPTARLARDLSIAEHLDEYRDVPSFEFLQHLDATFTEDDH